MDSKDTIQVVSRNSDNIFNDTGAPLIREATSPLHSNDIASELLSFQYHDASPTFSESSLTAANSLPSIPPSDASFIEKRRKLHHLLDPEAGRDINNLSRKKSLHKPQRAIKDSHGLPKDRKLLMDRSQSGWWTFASRCLTFYTFKCCLSRCGKKDSIVQQAFREKLALCTIIFVLCALVGFLTFGMTQTLCGSTPLRYKWTSLGVIGTSVRGSIRFVGQSKTDYPLEHPETVFGSIDIISLSMGSDIGVLFPVPESKSACKKAMGITYKRWPCTIPGIWPPTSAPTDVEACHTSDLAQSFLADRKYGGEVYFEWNDIGVRYRDRKLIVYNGFVLDVNRFLNENPNYLGPDFATLVSQNLYTDATKAFSAGEAAKEKADCLAEIFTVGTIDSQPIGCVMSNIVLYVSLIAICGVMIIKFVLAVAFSWMLAWSSGDPKTMAKTQEDRRRNLAKAIFISSLRKQSPSFTTGYSPKSISPIGLHSRSKTASPVPPFEVSAQFLDIPELKETPVLDARVFLAENFADSPVMNPMERNTLRYSTISLFSDLLLEEYYMAGRDMPDDPFLMHTILLVTCYSEDVQGIRNTLDSLAKTRYPDTHKCIFVVADGLVKGHGNEKTTPEICLDMMEIDQRFSAEDPTKGGTAPRNSYVAVAEGNRRKNCAQVYAGWYKPAEENKEIIAVTSDEATENCKKWTIGERVPMVLIVKCGNEEERDPAKKVSKPGNRGKRDSQLVLMTFLSRVLFDERLTEFEYDLYRKMWLLTGVRPDAYETVLMVDADTIVEPHCLKHMIAVMIQDAGIMGLCGETKIDNKWESWVSMIQVFEYYISHHFTKAFESVFGGVTCLPGCFSMYRIKALKGLEGHWVPILANPDIVEQYSENVVPTLHLKNLLLLGEDRYLTTLMLKTFPKRKNVFVPNAFCKTIVPSQLSVLISQRRRWINSTIHNLLELILVRDLCGTFCFSMQFIIFLELIGTVVLPAAICFTMYLIVLAGVDDEPPLVPLALLAAILGLPALLVLFTSREWLNVLWMFVYLLSLPVWNFLLPIYAFWHFDDFSWGNTRIVTGETKEDHGTKHGEFDGSDITMKRFIEWECDRKMVQVSHTARKRTATWEGSQIVSSLGSTTVTDV